MPITFLFLQCRENIVQSANLLSRFADGNLYISAVLFSLLFVVIQASYWKARKLLACFILSCFPYPPEMPVWSYLLGVKVASIHIHIQIDYIMPIAILTLQPLGCLFGFMRYVTCALETFQTLLLTLSQRCLWSILRVAWWKLWIWYI